MKKRAMPVDPQFDAALAGGVVVALAAPQADASTLARFDNEMAELLLMLIALWAYARTLPAPGSRRDWMLTGVAGMLFLLVWRGALLPLAVFGIDLLLRLIAARTQPGLPSLLGRRGAEHYLAMSGMAGLICLTDLWGTGSLFSYNIVSQFHVLLFALAASAVMLLGSWLEPAPGGHPTRRPVQLGLAALSLLLAALLAQNLFSGARMIGGGNAWIETIVQYQHPDAMTLIRFHGLFFLIAPLALLLLRLETFRDFPARRLVVVLTLTLFALALFRLRFAIYAAIPAALGVAIVCRYVLSLPPSGTRLARQLGIALLTLIALLPNLAYLKDMPRPMTARGDLGEALAWLRTQTPSAGDPLHPDRLPAYGVMSRWDYSGWVETVAGRPTVPTAYGTETYGMEETARFFLAVSETDMRAVLDRNRVRYLLLDKMAGDLEMYARLIGDTRPLVKRQWDASRQSEIVLPLPESFTLAASRLYFADGRSARVGPVRFEPVESVRLVWESASPGNVFGFPWEIRKLKIFEVHPGPEIAVTGPPGTTVTLSQPVETNQRRRFDYQAEKMLDATGRTHFLLPYAPKTVPGTTGSIGPAIIATGSFRQEIHPAGSEF
ncbi:MAG: hypothetical protein J0L74_11950, partial [Burkholderiales bacterium]|nr:hypothetical protein [Burkholderiales bacterium]